MNLIEALKSYVSKTFVYSGRASRSEYWWVTLTLGFLCMILVFALALLGEPIATTYKVVAGLGVLFLLPNMSLNARRLHDINLSGWFQVMGMFSHIGIGFLLILMVLGPKNNGNKYGEDPLRAIHEAY
jgi:uncharacterized membrane protein YhaH (DUF805 family)